MVKARWIARRLCSVFGRGWGRAVLLFLVGAAGFALLTLPESPPEQRGSRIVEGQRLGNNFRFQPLDSTGVLEDAPSIEIPGGRPVLLLVFASTCPSCFANLDAWREVLRSAPRAALPLGVALERDPRAAVEYARRNLPGVTVVVPRDPARFAAAFGVETVPFTAVVGVDGAVRYVRRGGLDSVAVRSLVEALEGI